MKMLWKGVAALGLTLAALSGTAAPAQAQVGYRDGGWRVDHDGWRDGRRWDDRRRWNDRRHWRGDRRHWRQNSGYHRGYRQRCWTEWRYDHYRDRDVRVRICR